MYSTRSDDHRFISFHGFDFGFPSGMSMHLLGSSLFFGSKRFELFQPSSWEYGSTIISIFYKVTVLNLILI